MALARGKWNMQVLLGVALCTIAVLAISLVWLLGQRRDFAYVVEVDELGNARYEKELAAVPIHDPVIVQAQVQQWIRDARTVVTDKVAFFAQLDRACGRNGKCLPGAQRYVKDDYDLLRPYEMIGRGESRIPQAIHVAAGFSKTDFQAYWTEQVVKDGRVVEQSKWEARLTVKLGTPEEAARFSATQRQQNPLLVYIDTVNWFRVS